MDLQEITRYHGHTGFYVQVKDAKVLLDEIERLRSSEGLMALAIAQQERDDAKTEIERLNQRVRELQANLKIMVDAGWKENEQAEIERLRTMLDEIHAQHKREINEIISATYMVNVDSELFPGLVGGSLSVGSLLATIRHVKQQRDDAKSEIRHWQTITQASGAHRSCTCAACERLMKVEVK